MCRKLQGHVEIPHGNTEVCTVSVQFNMVDTVYARVFQQQCLHLKTIFYAFLFFISLCFFGIEVLCCLDVLPHLSW